MTLITGGDYAELSPRQEVMVLIRTNNGKFYWLLWKFTDNEYQPEAITFQDGFFLKF